MAVQKSTQLFEQVFGGLNAQQVLDLIPVKIFMKDKDGVYFGANKAALDFAQNELDGKTDFDFFWKDFAETYRNNDQLVIENGVPQVFIEELMNDNVLVTYKTIKAPIFNNDGSTVGIIGVPIEIS